MDTLDKYFNQLIETADHVHQYYRNKIDEAIDILAETRKNKGTVYCIGVGGSAGNCSHLTNDLRKLCGINAICPTDNVSELTAWTNDESFDCFFLRYLETSNFSDKDAVLILSVGGGDKKRGISTGLISAINYCKQKNGKSIAIVGKNNGYCVSVADCAIICGPFDDNFMTPVSEAMQGVIWHGIVSADKLKTRKTTW